MVRKDFGVAQLRDAVRGAAQALRDLGARDATLYLGDMVPAGHGLPATVRHAVLGVRDALAGSVANLDVGEGGDEFAEPRVHGLDDGLGLVAAADVGLVGGDHEHIAGGGELGASLGHTGEKREFGQGSRRVGFAGADDLKVERAVAIKEDGGAKSGHRVGGEGFGTVKNKKTRRGHRRVMED